MTDYLVIEDSTSKVVGIGSAVGLAVTGQTVRAVDDDITLNRELILRGATVTLTNGVVTAITYPSTINRTVEKFIGRVQAVVGEVIEVNRRLPITNSDSRDAWQATESWAIHLGGAGRLVTHNLITGTTLTATQQEAAIAQLETMPGATKIWNGVMKGDSSKRNLWLNFPYTQGASVYVDCLTAEGNPRNIDGRADIIMPGGFPANFDPYNIS